MLQKRPAKVRVCQSGEWVKNNPASVRPSLGAAPERNMAVVPSDGVGQRVHWGPGKVLEEVFEFAIIGPGVKVSSHNRGLLDCVPAVGPGCSSAGWSGQPWPSFLGGHVPTRPSTSVEGKTAASAPPARPLVKLVFVLIFTIQIYFNRQPAKVISLQPVPSESRRAWGRSGPRELPGDAGVLWDEAMGPVVPGGKGGC